MRPFPKRLVFLLLLAMAAPAFAWDANGHRIIPQLAVESMAPDVPDWLKDPAIIAQIADQSTVPDRWRSDRIPQLTHLNNPDHYLDVEDLEAYGLTLKT